MGCKSNSYLLLLLRMHLHLLLLHVLRHMLLLRRIGRAALAVVSTRSGRRGRIIHSGTLSERLIHHEHATSLGLTVERLLLLESLLDQRAEDHLTHVVLARLGVIVAQSDELTTKVTITALVALTLLRMLHHTLELHALGECAVGIAAQHGVHERLEIDLDVRLELTLGVEATCALSALGAALLSQGGLFGVRAAPLATALAALAGRIRARQQLLHLVIVPGGLVALRAQVKILTGHAVVADLHRVPTLVARVYELLRVLVVQLVQQSHG